MIRAALPALVDLVLPVSCVGCTTPGSALCPACRVWDGPRRVRPEGFDVVAATRYEGPARQVLLHHKERGRRDLARPLGRALACAVSTLLADHGVPARSALLVAVPSSRAAHRARGRDHLAVPVRLAARGSGVPARRGVLRPVRAVADSAGLGAAERARNLGGALVALPPRGRAIAVVVDDIVTTGSTVLESRRALEASGWVVLGAAVIAATARRHRAAFPTAGIGSAQ